VDAERVAVGGHSYGAFMTANILAHCGERFACGIAQSGAYNRTLTPFGFQAEQRTFWAAPHVYAAMAPFNNAHKIQTPLLLIHGEADNNTGALRGMRHCMLQHWWPVDSALVCAATHASWSCAPPLPAAACAAGSP
jgi:dipeptidyl aminopeptidase/acylaminoacyl peptidase